MHDFENCLSPVQTFESTLYITRCRPTCNQLIICLITTHRRRRGILLKDHSSCVLYIYKQWHQTRTRSHLGRLEEWSNCNDKILIRNEEEVFHLKWRWKWNLPCAASTTITVHAFAVSPAWSYCMPCVVHGIPTPSYSYRVTSTQSYHKLVSYMCTFRSVLVYLSPHVYLVSELFWSRRHLAMLQGRTPLKLQPGISKGKRRTW